MEKFLSIPVTSEQNQLISATGIVLIEQESTTTLHVHYKSSTGTDVVVITHATAPAGNETMRDAIQDALIAALQTSWTHVAYQVNNLPFAVSGITIS
jgi:predicted RNA binding protein YcfA (HicA-like mRNA interferase family)